jgi:tetratricopeptide (TPR) repeat protein
MSSAACIGPIDSPMAELRGLGWEANVVRDLGGDSFGHPAGDDLRSALAVAEQLLDGSRRTSGREVVATVLVSMSIAAWEAGRATDALWLLRAAAAQSASGPAGLRVQSKLPLAAALTALGRHDEAEQEIAAAEAQIDRDDLVGWRSGALAGRAVLDLALGRPDDATSRASAALSLSDELGTARFVPAAAAVLADVAVMRRDISGALRKVSRIRADSPKAARASDRAHRRGSRLAWPRAARGTVNALRPRGRPSCRATSDCCSTSRQPRPA